MCQAAGLSMTFLCAFQIGLCSCAFFSSFQLKTAWRCEQQSAGHKLLLHCFLFLLDVARVLLDLFFSFQLKSSGGRWMLKLLKPAGRGKLIWAAAPFDLWCAFHSHGSICTSLFFFHAAGRMLIGPCCLQMLGREEECKPWASEPSFSQATGQLSCTACLWIMWRLHESLLITCCSIFMCGSWHLQNSNFQAVHMRPLLFAPLSPLWVVDLSCFGCCLFILLMFWAQFPFLFSPN